VDPWLNRRESRLRITCRKRTVRILLRWDGSTSILIEGDEAWNIRSWCRKRGVTAGVNGRIKLLGNMFNYKGPMLFMAGPEIRSGNEAGRDR